MLGDTTSARDAFRSFVDLQEKFRPSDVDRVTLGQRDLDAAIEEALDRLR